MSDMARIVSKVWTGLYVGAIDDELPDELLRERRRCFVSCVATQVSPTPPCVVYPFEDSMFGMSDEDERAALFLVDSAEHLLRLGRTVIVVCRQGANRSVLVTALVLLRILPGWSADQAIEHLRKSRRLDPPVLSSNLSFIEFIREQAKS